MNKKLLIIGASGLIGGSLARSLSQNYTEIIGVYRNPYINRYLTSTINLNYENISSKLIKKIDPDDILIAYSDVFQFNQYLNFKGNEEILLKKFSDLLETIGAAHNLERIFFISSAGALYNTSNPIQESSKINPSSSYGFVKSRMESLLIDFCQSESIQFGIFRLSNVYGNKIDGSISGGFINTAIRSAFNHEVFKIVRNSQNFYRDFIFIDDVVYILSFLIMRFNFNSNLIVNIASGSSYNLCEVKNIILQKLSEYGITLSLEDLIDDYIGPKVTSFNNDMLQKLIPSLIFTQLKKGILQTIIRTQNFYDLKNP